MVKPGPALKHTSTARIDSPAPLQLFCTMYDIPTYAEGADVGIGIGGEVGIGIGVELEGFELGIEDIEVV